jgi:hypothetical protein
MSEGIFLASSNPGGASVDEPYPLVRRGSRRPRRPSVERPRHRRKRRCMSSGSPRKERVPPIRASHSTRLGQRPLGQTRQGLLKRNRYGRDVIFPFGLQLTRLRASAKTKGRAQERSPTLRGSLRIYGNPTGDVSHASNFRSACPASPPLGEPTIARELQRRWHGRDNAGGLRSVNRAR